MTLVFCYIPQNSARAEASFTIILKILLQKNPHIRRLQNPAFLGGDRKFSTASNLTNVSAINELYRNKAPNNRKVFLNGISGEILNIETTVPGAIYVKIKFYDYNIRNNVRWCADTIVLPQHYNNQTKKQIKKLI